MHAVLGAVLVSHPGNQPLSGTEIETQLAQYPSHSPIVSDGADQGLGPLLDRLMEGGGFSLSEFAQSAYQAALDRAGGNLSAAARLLGLSRAQLAYRLGTTSQPEAVAERE